MAPDLLDSLENLNPVPLRFELFHEAVDEVDPADAGFRMTVLRPFLCSMTDTYCDHIRSEHGLERSIPIVILSGTHFERAEWLYGAGENGNPNYFLHTDMWKAYGERSGFEPLSFELAGVYIHEAMKQAPGDMVIL